MSSGRLIAVVGPSGVGKDTVMTALADARPDIHLVRRVITRTPGLGGEDYAAVSEAQFDQMAESGAFALLWDAHGLRYGLLAEVRDQVAEGGICLANFSRAALIRGAGVFSRFGVLNITASQDTLAKRLAARGRETEEVIRARLSRAGYPLPEGLDVMTVSNDGDLAGTVAAALDLLQPVRV